ncbi:MAG TPA: hypothetical protein VHO50_13255 [Bacteroidales bacterium]|nr:hypothetical protein [Bacteroidales bacterium]
MEKKRFIGISYTLLVVLCLLLTVFPDVTGQRARQEAPPLKERFFFGGSFGLQFGSISDIEISPVAGFWVLPRLAIAAGPEYKFFKYYTQKTSIWGAKGYAEFSVLRNINSVIPLGSNTDIILHIEDDLLSLESEFFKNPPYTSKRFYNNTILGGAGLSQQIGRRSALNILILWTLNEDHYGVYSNPDIRISFMF